MRSELYQCVASTTAKLTETYFKIFSVFFLRRDDQNFSFRISGVDVAASKVVSCHDLSVALKGWSESQSASVKSRLMQPFPKVILWSRRFLHLWLRYPRPQALLIPSQSIKMSYSRITLTINLHCRFYSTGGAEAEAIILGLKTEHFCPTMIYC